MEAHTYANIRESIRSGDLLAFSHGDFKSFNGLLVKSVRVFTTSTYSHVAVAWVAKDRVFALEAVVPKVRIFPLSLLGDFDLIPLEAPWLAETEQYALSKVGADYSRWTAIQGFFNPLEEGDVSECAAYAREVLKRDGIDLGKMSRPDTVIHAAQDLGASLIHVANGGYVA